MKSEIQGIKKEGDRFGLVLAFSGIKEKSERSELEKILDSLFINCVGPFSWDISSETLGEVKNVEYIGKTSLFFGKQIYQTASFCDESAKVTVDLPKELMVDYLRRLKNSKGVETDKNYVNRVKELN